MPDSPKSITLPTTEDRTLILGRTGSGKTIMGLWMLSMMPLAEMPWIIIDFKRERQIAQIPYIKYAPIGFLPKEPGLYVVRAQPDIDDEALTEYFYALWDREHVGLYIDEGVMVSRNPGLDAILIQGRSKEIPVIMVSQRPTGISRYAFSESQVFVVFPSHDRRERDTIAEFTSIFPRGSETDEVMLPRFHSYYYNATEHKSTTLRPVPNLDAILRTFERKLRPVEQAQAMGENVPVKVQDRIRGL